MKKLIFLIGVIFFSGCSFKSYNKTVYPNYESTSYHSISTDGVWCGFDGCDDNYNKQFYKIEDGTYLKDEF